ncbi:hypothetical protein I7I48_02808 [Histoplasma ohiense]|nr:hypothetical protein I7I48_02808 [Histoplasma ohiense (nom. inval.)]
MITIIIILLGLTRESALVYVCRMEMSLTVAFPKLGASVSSRILLSTSLQAPGFLLRMCARDS